MTRTHREDLTNSLTAPRRFIRPERPERPEIDNSDTYTYVYNR